MRNLFKKFTSIFVCICFLMPLCAIRVHAEENVIHLYATGTGSFPDVVNQGGKQYKRVGEPESKSVTFKAWQYINCNDRWKYTGKPLKYEGGEYWGYDSSGDRILVSKRDAEGACQFLGNMDEDQRRKNGISTDTLRSAWFPNPFGRSINEPEPKKKIEVLIGDKGAFEALKQMGMNEVSFINGVRGTVGVVGTIKGYSLPPVLKPGVCFWGQKYEQKMAFTSAPILYYDATYTADGIPPTPVPPTPVPPTPVPPIKPPTVGGIIFRPNETPWTNKGKISEGKGAYPVNVQYVGDNPVVLRGTVKSEEEVCHTNSKGKEKCHTRHHTKHFDVKYKLKKIDVSGDENTTVGGASGNISVKKEGEDLNLHAIGTWEKPDYDVPDMPGTITDTDIPDPPEKPKGDSGDYDLDWTTPTFDISVKSTPWTNKGKDSGGFPVDLKYYEELSGHHNTSYKFSDSSYYHNDIEKDIPEKTTGTTKIQEKLQEGMFKYKTDFGDIAGNKGDYSTSEYLIDFTNPWISVNPPKEVYWTNKGKSSNGHGAYPINFTMNDNLSGLLNSHWDLTDEFYHHDDNETFSTADRDKSSKSVNLGLDQGVYSLGIDLKDRATNKFSDHYGLWLIDYTDPTEQIAEIAHNRAINSLTFKTDIQDNMEENQCLTITSKTEYGVDGVTIGQKSPSKKVEFLHKPANDSRDVRFDSIPNEDTNYKFSIRTTDEATNFIEKSFVTSVVREYWERLIVTYKSNLDLEVPIKFLSNSDTQTLKGFKRSRTINFDSWRGIPTEVWYKFTGKTVNFIRVIHYDDPKLPIIDENGNKLYPTDTEFKDSPGLANKIGVDVGSNMEITNYGRLSLQTPVKTVDNEDGTITNYYMNGDVRTIDKATGKLVTDRQKGYGVILDDLTEHIGNKTIYRTGNRYIITITDCGSYSDMLIQDRNLNTVEHTRINKK